MRETKPRAAHDTVTAMARKASKYEPTGRQAKAFAGLTSLLLALLAAALLHAVPAWADTTLPDGFVGPVRAAAVTASAFAGGTGTEDDPYLIENAEQLEAFRDSVNAGNDYAGQTVKLAADVDIAGMEWTPIGTGTRKGSGISAGSTPFSGTFDGDGHAISGLTITSTPDADYALGLFGIVSGGEVRGLTLRDAQVSAASSELAGAAVGLMVSNSKLSDVLVSGSVSGASGIGGLVGRMTLSGTITECTNDATVTQTGSTGNVGGIVGAAYYTTPSGQMIVSGCTNNGTVSGSNAVGGIVGLGAAFVDDCTNNGAVTASSYGTGGIVGDQKNYGGINGCTNTATVTNTSATAYGTGGIVGWVRYDGVATAYMASAPIAITGNANAADVKGGNDAGGIVGCLYNAGTVTGNTNTAARLQGSAFAGGIVGCLQNIDPGALPKNMTAGGSVVNNVSTTSPSAVLASYASQYAYNNDPETFTVQDNGMAWVALLEGVRYASVPLAVSEASAGGTVTLIAEAEGVDTVEMNGRGTAVLDLNGHDIAFDASPAFKVTSGELVVVGSGHVATTQDDLSSLVQAPSPASFVLDGGIYRQDVSQYVGEGYQEEPLADDPLGFAYQVVAKTSGSGTTGADGRVPIAGTPLPTASAKPAADADRATVSAGSANQLAQVGDGTAGPLGCLVLALLASVACMAVAEGQRKGRPILR